MLEWINGTQGRGVKLDPVMPRLLSLSLAAVCGACAHAPMQVEDIGSFHISGRQVTLSGLPITEVTLTAGAPPVRLDPNGDFQTGQMYVQYVRLAAPKKSLPILMWHGGGLTGVTWETTPDGRPGWQAFFLKRGYDLYVSDAVERGRASWSRYPEIYSSPPFFLAGKDAWELFRIGPPGSYSSEPAARKIFESGRFPAAAFDQFRKQAVPRWATNDEPTQAAYHQLVERVGPCIIIVHSSGSNFAYQAALRRPDLVRAVVAIEPSGAPDPGTVDVARVKGVAHLTVWGDNTERSAFWQRMMPGETRYRQALSASGARADAIDLPKHGIRGNTHMLMMDSNSDEIAALIEDWLVRSGVTR